MSMYRCDDLCLSNEDLALRIQDGDPQAAPLLLSQNEGYLTMLAASYCAQFSQDFLVDDLKQEGALALLDAARRYDPSMGTKLLTYATPAIETAMRDCAAQGSFSLSLPLDRYHQLRQVAFLYATHEGDIETDLLPASQEKLTVSAKVARRLLEEYRTVFQVEWLGEGVFDLGYGGDPARASAAAARGPPRASRIRAAGQAGGAWRASSACWASPRSSGSVERRTSRPRRARREPRTLTPTT